MYYDELNQLLQHVMLGLFRTSSLRSVAAYVCPCGRCAMAFDLYGTLTLNTHAPALLAGYRQHRLTWLGEPLD